MNGHSLYLDTSGPVATLIVFRGSEKVNTFSWEVGRELSAVLSDKVKEILAVSKIDYPDLQALHILVGPGSFTGLRIGISYFNGLALALGVPIFETKISETISCKNPQKIAKPQYGAPPNITKPKERK